MTREPLYDVVKCVLMYFIICGHSVGGLFASPSNAWWEPYLANATVGVSMPLFFAMSGYFARRTFERADAAKIAARTLTFLWPILSVSILYGLVAWALGEIGLRDLPGCPYKMFVQLWFLRTIVVVYLTSAVIWKLFLKDRLRIAAFALAYVAMIFNPSHYRLFFLSDAMHMLPYFVFGLYALGKPVLKRALVVLGCGILFVGTVLFEGNVWQNGMAFYGITRWQDMFFSTRGWVCFFGRTAVGIAGSVFLLGLFDWLLKVVPPLSRLTVFGTTTLGVYALQIWPLARYAEHPAMQFPSWMAWPGAALIYIALHLVVKALRSNAILRMAFFGDEHLVELCCKCVKEWLKKG